MPLLQLDDVSLAFGERQILDRVKLTVQPGERVCLIGRNGEGKSTLLKVISERVDADEGTRWVRPGHRVSVLEQDASASDDLSVLENVTLGVPKYQELLLRYQRALAGIDSKNDKQALRELANAEHALEVAGGWDLKQRIDELLSKLGLDPDTSLQSLSGGWRRRAMLARALISEPDLLLLDEPTNHLDIAAITWLEQFMLEFAGALLFVSHDRAFSRRLATRVIELDRGRLSSWPGGLDHYLKRKTEQLAAEEKAQSEFDKRLSKEEAWIRQGIKARRTRNEGRVRALKEMRRAASERRERMGTSQIQLAGTEYSGKIVVDTIDASAGYGEQVVIKPTSLRILRGDRIGIVGPNGSGKSTLLKLLLGELAPLSGTVTMGTKIDPVYFDQQRASLNESESVIDNVNDGSEFIEVQGKKRHVAGYLRDFMFPPQRFRSPVSTLSGGERNRLLLAKLLANPTNLMILDEPTNDLDVETLELLEDLLLRYEGTLLVVSHDREFLDNVVSGILHLEDDGQVLEYVGNYTDFKRQHEERQRSEKQSDPTAAAPRAAPIARALAANKLSYKEQRELDALPAGIEALEAEQVALTEETADPAFYSLDHQHVAARLDALQRVGEKLENAYARWGELEGRVRKKTPPEH